MSHLLDPTPVLLVAYTTRAGDLCFPVTCCTIDRSVLTAVRKARKKIHHSGLVPVKLISVERVL